MLEGRKLRCMDLTLPLALRVKEGATTGGSTSVQWGTSDAEQQKNKVIENPENDKIILACLRGSEISKVRGIAGVQNHTRNVYFEFLGIAITLIKMKSTR